MNPIISRRDVVGLLGLGALGGAGALGLARPAAAQPPSDKPVRIILPISAGSGVDAIARAAAPSLGKALAQPVVIENLPGAGGITGAAAVVKAAPDGLTLGMVSNNHVINPAVYRKMPFDAVNDVTPICVVGATPLVLVVNPKVPARSVKELVALVKARPDAMNYASSGNGTIIHLAGEMFMDQAGLKVRHIPYKGTGPMVTDMIAGQVEIGVVALPAVQPHLQSGALRAIGVCGAQRSPAAPEIPTIAEQGLVDYDVEGWFAVIGPAKLPAAEVQRIHKAVVAAFQMPELVEAMARQGNIIKPGSPDAAAKFFRTEAARYAALVKKANVVLE